MSILLLRWSFDRGVHYLIVVDYTQTQSTRRFVAAQCDHASVIIELMSRLTDFELAVPIEQLTYAPSLTSMPLESLPLRFKKID